MSNFFENIKNLLFKSFLKNKDYDLDKENHTTNNKKHLEKTQHEKEGDETSILIEEYNNNRFANENYFNKQKLLSASLIQNKLMPMLYLTFSFSSLIFLMLSENSNGRRTENYISIDPENNKKLFNFFNYFEK